MAVEGAAQTALGEPSAEQELTDSWAVWGGAEASLSLAASGQ